MFSFRYEFRKRYGTNYTQACADLVNPFARFNVTIDRINATRV